MKWKIRLSAGPTISQVAAPRPVVRLRARTRFGDWAVVPFAVDTGADCTCLPAEYARREGIPFPQTAASRGQSHGLLGLVEHQRGLIRLRLGTEEFDRPCDFLILPATPPTAPQPSIRASSHRAGVLGRAGFLDDFRVCFDSPFLTIERRPRSWWQRLRRLLPSFTSEHPAVDPL